MVAGGQARCVGAACRRGHGWLGAVGGEARCRWIERALPKGVNATVTRCSLGRHAEWGGRAWDLCHMTRELTKLDWGTWQTQT